MGRVAAQGRLARPGFRLCVHGLDRAVDQLPEGLGRRGLLQGCGGRVGRPAVWPDCDRCAGGRFGRTGRMAGTGPGADSRHRRQVVVQAAEWCGHHGDLRRAGVHGHAGGAGHERRQRRRHRAAVEGAVVIHPRPHRRVRRRSDRPRSRRVPGLQGLGTQVSEASRPGWLRPTSPQADHPTGYRRLDRTGLRGGAGGGVLDVGGGHRRPPTTPSASIRVCARCRSPRGASCWWPSPAWR